MPPTGPDQSPITTARPPRGKSAVSQLITAGVFLALYLIMVVASGMIIGVFPPVMLGLPIIFGLLGGVIFIVMLSRAPRAGLFLIASILVGLIVLSMAPGGFMAWFTIAGGIVAEILYGLLGRKRFLSMATAYCVFILAYALGEYIPFVWMKDAYIALYANRNDGSLAVAETGVDLMSPPLLIGLSLASVVAALLGCLWGRSLIRRQFAKAGIITASGANGPATATRESNG